MALIVDGKMPSCCAVCWDCNSADDGNFCNRTGNRLGKDWQLYKPLNCPIRGEIPDRHGNLIDQDKVLTNVTNLCSDKDTETLKDAIMMIPVVVEASK